MRYAQGGGLTDERRVFREKLRMDAAERFAQGDENSVIAHDLRVSVRSVQRWRRAWSQDGPGALASKGPASVPLLSDELFAVLERELVKGPAAHGWPDQTWTLSRIRTLIGRRFHKGYTVQGVAALLKRHGWSCQVPARRALERDEAAVRLGEGDLAERGRTVAALDAWLVFEDEAGFSMTPPTTRTWSRRGHTPVIRVRGRSRRRLSVAALACYKAGEPSRLIYRPCPDARPDGRKSFSWKDYRDLIQSAHQQLGGPIVLVWDNLNTHLTAGMRRYVTDRDWLTVFQLPPYAPDLNPVEGIWSVLRRTTTANRAFVDPDDLITAVRRGLRQLQYRPDVLDGCLTGTGLRRQPP
ncbi:IS630 family transposase [Streptomyces griseoaurantiacus]|uniref:IS630 family transposase n=1 Tax=Streptomyces griseoaurantiacus TaxID=68213 RepID=UPI003F585D70